MFFHLFARLGAFRPFRLACLCFGQMRGRSTSTVCVRRSVQRALLPVGALCLAFLAAAFAWPQNRLANTPEYARYRAQTRKLRTVADSIRRGTLEGRWTEDGNAYVYRNDGKWTRYHVMQQKTEPADVIPPRPAPSLPFEARAERGRQLQTYLSPDRQWTASYKNGNVWLSRAKGADPIQVSPDGNPQTRLVYGTACWVYGEELEQHTAMWWSPDSKKLAYYRVDESRVPIFTLARSQEAGLQNMRDAEPYPKAGDPNPLVDLTIYDVQTRQNVRMDVRDGKPFTNDVVGHYVYNVQWSPDGNLLLFYRLNRRQNVLELAACDPNTGHSRVIVHEARPQSWVAIQPTLRFLKDGRRFVWDSERSGWRNLYIYDLSGKLLHALTKHPFEVERIERIDEAANLLYYMARDGDNPLKLQLHRVHLDGTGDTRLTDPHYTHRVEIAPGGKAFLDIAQTHDQPPLTRLVSAEGNILTTLAQADASALKAEGLTTPEMFTYKAGDGKTDLYGLLYKPSSFDPHKKYPLLIEVYGGPEEPREEHVNENFQLPRSLPELGFLVAVFDGRGSVDRGKAFKDAVYGKLGQVEIDDQALGVKTLRQRPYVDGTRVGIYGTSYGGYAAIMCLLRYPDVFTAASASSSVTDWRCYDSIYTERYMGLPQDNRAAYDAGSALTYAPNLQGKLLLYYGTADNNVHPDNTLQLMDALKKAGKTYELEVGQNEDHTAVDRTRMLEFFLSALSPKPQENTKSVTP